MIHHGLLLGEDGKKLSKRHGACVRRRLSRRRASRRPPLRAYLDELGLPAHDVHLDRGAPRPAGDRGDRGDARRGARGGLGGRSARARARAPRCPYARRGAGDRRAILESRARSSCPRRPRPTLERFAELRARAPEHLDEAGARAIVRELKAVGGDLRALRLALTGEPARAGALDRPRRAARRRGSRSRAARRGTPARATPTLGLRLRSRMRLQDTLTRLARRAAASSRADRDLRLRARPSTSARTSATRGRSWCSRGSRGGSGHGHEVDARPQHHGRQRQDLRGGARAQRRAGARGDALVPRGHRRLRARDARRAARSRPRRWPRSSR